MTIDEIQNIIDYSYPKIQKYYGKGSLEIPKIELHKDIYARLSGDEEAEGEHSRTTKAEYDDNTNVIYIYYPNMKSKEDVIRSIIHEYTLVSGNNESANISNCAKPNFANFGNILLTPFFGFLSNTSSANLCAIL